MNIFKKFIERYRTKLNKCTKCANLHERQNFFYLNYNLYLNEIFKKRCLHTNIIIKNWFMTWLQDEYIGNVKLCSDCILLEKERITKKADEFIQFVNQKHDTFETPQIWSQNYKGKIPFDSNINIKVSSDNYYKDKEDAIYSMKILAIWHDCNIIYNVEYEQETESEATDTGGRYYYNVWYAKGIASKSRNIK